MMTDSVLDMLTIGMVLMVGFVTMIYIGVAI